MQWRLDDIYHYTFVPHAFSQSGSMWNVHWPILPQKVGMYNISWSSQITFLCPSDIMNNKVFYQHPNLMRVLGMHETVMEVMVNVLGGDKSQVGWWRDHILAFSDSQGLPLLAVVGTTKCCQIDTVTKVHSWQTISTEGPLTFPLCSFWQPPPRADWVCKAVMKLWMFKLFVILMTPHSCWLKSSSLNCQCCTFTYEWTSVTF